jgi:hypothetical protein
MSVSTSGVVVLEIHFEVSVLGSALSEKGTSYVPFLCLCPDGLFLITC